MNILKLLLAWSVLCVPHRKCSASCPHPLPLSRARERGAEGGVQRWNNVVHRSGKTTIINRISRK